MRNGLIIVLCVAVSSALTLWLGAALPTIVGLLAIIAAAMFALERPSFRRIGPPIEKSIASDPAESNVLESNIATDESSQDDLNSDELIDQLSKISYQLLASSQTLEAYIVDRKKSINHQVNSVNASHDEINDVVLSTRKISEMAQVVFQAAEKTQANNRLVADRIVGLDRQAERADGILENVETIAARSDLVALNASLEGLRAGEAGKKFSLAAEEMRRLSETIRQETGAVRVLIQQIRSSTTASVMATEEGSNLSEKNTESALKITSIISEQQTGFDTVSEGFETLLTFLEHDTAGSEHAGSSITGLTELAGQLDALLVVLKDGESISTLAKATEVEISLRATSYPNPFDSDEVARHRLEVVADSTSNEILQTGEFTAPMRSTMVVGTTVRHDDGPVTVEIAFDGEE